MNLIAAPIRRIGLIVGLSTVALVAAAGCSDEQRRDLGEVDIRDTLASQVEQVVEDEGLQLAGELDCVADIDDADLAVTGSCSGATSSGAAVAGAFSGTADVEAGECTARFTVHIDDQAVADEASVDCFNVL